MNSTPIYQTPRAALYQGACEKLLLQVEDETVDAIITDPPYSSGGQFRSDRVQDTTTKYCHSGNDCGRVAFSGDNRDQRSFGWWMMMWLQECYRITKPGGYCLLFTDWRQLPTVTDIFQAGGFTQRGIIAWNKGRGSRAPHKGFFRHQCEYVVWGTKGKIKKATHDGPYEGCVTAHVKQSDKFHQTGKPTPLMEELVRPVEPEGLILDPFAGSATTGVAAIRHGRRFIGFELGSENIRIGAERLKREEEARNAKTAAA